MTCGIFLDQGSSDFIFKNIYIFIWLRSVLVAACGISFPNEGSNPGSLYWEPGVLTSGSSEKSPVWLSLGKVLLTQLWTDFPGAADFVISPSCTKDSFSSARTAYLTVGWNSRLLFSLSNFLEIDTFEPFETVLDTVGEYGLPSEARLYLHINGFSPFSHLLFPTTFQS